MPRAFVLISFEEPFESVYTSLIKAPLEEVGFEVERADSRLDQRSILQDIFRGIAGADLVVADLTGLNPNVFYELGVAHALEIPTILLTQNVDELPFDLRAYRANEYSTHFTDAPKLVETLREIGRGAIDRSIRFSSPATDYLPPEFRRGGPSAPAGAVVEEPRSEETGQETAEGLAWLDALQESQGASDEFVATLGRIGAATAGIGEQVQAHAVQMENLAVVPESQRVKRATVLAAAIGRDLDAFADAIETEVPAFESSSALALNGMTQYVEWLQANPEVEAGEELAELHTSAQELTQAIQTNLPSLRELRRSIVGLQGISRLINSSSARVGKGLDRLITGIETMEAEAARIVLVAETLQARASDAAGEDEPEAT